jgi:hypothetical protein
MKATAVVLAAISMLAGCAVTPTAQTVSNVTFSTTEEPTQPAQGSTVVSFAAQRFAFDLLSSANAPDDNTAALTAFKSGKAMIDLECATYLDALGIANQKAGNERQQVGLVGGLAAAVAGLTGTAARDIAIGAAGFSFAGSSMDAYTNAYLFSDASKSISKLVRDAQGTFMNDVSDKLDQLDYPSAVAMLTAYENICRPGEIRRMVDEAISAARIVAQTPGALSPDAAVQDVLWKLTGQLGRPVDESQAITLYAWFIGAKAQRDAIKAQSDLIADLAKAPSSDADLLKKLAPVFVPLSTKGNPVAARWAVAVGKVPGGEASPEAKRLFELRRSLAVTPPILSVERTR